MRPELRLELLAAELEPLPPEAAAAAATCTLLQPQSQAPAPAPPEDQVDAAPAGGGAHAPAANGTRAAPTAAGPGGDISSDGDGAAAAVGAHAAHASAPPAQRSHPADSVACNGTVPASLVDAEREPGASAGAGPAADSGQLAAAARSRMDPSPAVNSNPSTSNGGSAPDAGPAASDRDGAMGAAGHAAAAPTDEVPAVSGEPCGAAACGLAVTHTGDADPASTLVLAIVTALQVHACAGYVIRAFGSAGQPDHLPSGTPSADMQHPVEVE